MPNINELCEAIEFLRHISDSTYNEQLRKNPPNFTSIDEFRIWFIKAWSGVILTRNWNIDPKILKSVHIINTCDNQQDFEEAKNLIAVKYVLSS